MDHFQTKQDQVASMSDQEDVIGPFSFKKKSAALTPISKKYIMLTSKLGDVNFGVMEAHIRYCY